VSQKQRAFIDRSTIEHLFSVPRISEAAVSPDTRWVAWSWDGLGGEGMGVYVAPTDGTRPPRRLGEGAVTCELASWSPDSRSILVVCETDGDERSWLCRVHITEPEKLEALTETTPNYFLRGGSLHPDGRTLVYGANVDLETGREIEPTCVIRKDLVTGARQELTRPERGGASVPRLSPTGSHILYFRNDLDPAGVQAWLVDVDGREDIEIINVGDALSVQADWFPDGQRLVVVAESAARSHRRLGVWELNSSRLTWLVDDRSLNIEHASVPPGSTSIVALVGEDARTRSILVDPKSGEIREPTSDPRELILLGALDAGHWIARCNDSTSPSDLVRLSFPTPCATSYRSLAGAWMKKHHTPSDGVRPVDHRWTSIDGLEIQGWLYEPRSKAQGTIVCVHGGPTWHCGNTYDPEAQCYCRAGFNVLVPNYRGSTGFSLAYEEAIRAGGWGSLEQEDIRTGIASLIERGIAEHGRIGITGLSFGGYSAWFAITHFPPDTVAAAVPICGMTDLVLDYERTRPDLRPLTDRMMGGRPDQVPDRYRERSPCCFIDRIRGRLLVVQGMRDPNVPPEHVHVVRPLLDEASVEYDILWLEEEGHGITKLANQVLVMTRAIDFFRKAFGEASNA